MWSPNGKVWSPEMKIVESKILQSRSVIMMLGASLTFRSKGDVYTNSPPLLVTIFALCVLSLSFSQKNFARYARSIACNRRNYKFGHATKRSHVYNISVNIQDEPKK